MSDSRKADWDPRAEEVLRDQRAAYDAMRERCPVAYSPFMQWSLFRHADVVRVLHDHHTFSNAGSRHLSVPNGMDPPEHTAYRRIIERYFADPPMAAFEPVCREIAVDLVCGAVARAEIEVMEILALPLAARVQCAFLGWPPNLHVPLIRWTQTNYAATLARDRDALSQLAREFEAIVDQQLEVRWSSGAEPAEDVTASLMHEQVNGRPLSNEEIASILRNWTVGEIGTLSASVGILAHYLATHPDLRERLGDDPSLVPAAIEEILRIDGPLATNRRMTTCPVQIGGRSLGAGEQVTLNWIAANRDERAFEDPESVRLDRDPKDNLLWGAGIHVCPGAPLARLQLRVYMEELLGRTSQLELVPDKPPVRGVYPACGFATLPMRIR